MKLKSVRLALKYLDLPRSLFLKLFCHLDCCQKMRVVWYQGVNRCQCSLAHLVLPKRRPKRYAEEQSWSLSDNFNNPSLKYFEAQFLDSKLSDQFRDRWTTIDKWLIRCHLCEQILLDSTSTWVKFIDLQLGLITILNRLPHSLEEDYHLDIKLGVSQLGSYWHWLLPKYRHLIIQLNICW